MLVYVHTWNMGTYMVSLWNEGLGYWTSRKSPETSYKKVKSLSGLSYEQRLIKQNLPTLHEISTSSWRHDRHFFKFCMEFTTKLFQKEQDRRTRGHSLKLVTQHCTLFLSPSMVKPWNSLPEFVVSSITVQMLESTDWIKCGQISLFVSATRKSSDSKY